MTYWCIPSLQMSMWDIESLCCRSSTKTNYMPISPKVNLQVQKWIFLDMCCFGKGWGPTQGRSNPLRNGKAWFWPKGFNKGFRLLLGLTNFYKKFIKDFFAMEIPFIDFLKKEGSFEWKEKQQSVFDLLKRKLSSTLVLQFPNFTKPFEVHTNANRWGLDAKTTPNCLWKQTIEMANTWKKIVCGSELL